MGVGPTKVPLCPVKILNQSVYCKEQRLSRNIVLDIMNLANEFLITEVGGVSERRGTSRFPMREEVRYKMLHGKVVTTGAGKTLNIGSGGILFYHGGPPAHRTHGRTLRQLARATGRHVRVEVRRHRPCPPGGRGSRRHPHRALRIPNPLLPAELSVTHPGGP